MAKKMSLTGPQNLLIERDSGNPIMILMDGTDKEKNWKKLRKLCDKALQEITNNEAYDYSSMKGE